MSAEYKRNAFDKAAGYLSLQPRTEQEIRAYLKKKEFGEEEIEDAVAKLLEYGYLDDAAYCESYLRLAAARGKGRRRMEMELAAKGISRSTMEHAFSRIADEEADAAAGSDRKTSILDEKKRALEVAAKMARQQLADGKPLDEKFLARVGRRLAGQGYAADVIYFAVGRLRDLQGRR